MLIVCPKCGSVLVLPDPKSNQITLLHQCDRCKTLLEYTMKLRVVGGTDEKTYP